MLAQRGARSGGLLWIAGEIFIVAVGVLIAFGLNAWWVERSTRVEEQTHLRALARDFELNVALYQSMLEKQELIIGSTLEMLQLARKQPDADSAVVARLMNGVLTSFRDEPALDAYHALVNSAGLALIRDDALRNDLAGFAGRATGLYEQEYAHRLYMDFTTRFVGRLVSQRSSRTTRSRSRTRSYWPTRRFRSTWLSATSSSARLPATTDGTCANRKTSSGDCEERLSPALTPPARHS